MSGIPEFVVDIAPGAGSSLRVCVQAGGLAPIADEVERALPSFPPADLERLRGGSASERIAAELSDKVTRWLLESDLRGHLGTALNAAAAPFRIVIRAHPKALADLSEVPFELLRFDADPLLFLHNVRAIVHMASRPHALPAPVTRSGWPLRVLLVRSNPADLGGKVPPILPLRRRILELAGASRLGDAVSVTALTSEPGGSGTVTYDAVRAALHEQSYTVLVYLGHGDLQDAGFDGLTPIGVLQLELEGSPYSNPIRADQLRAELHNHPVPLVVLAGCVTAASDPAPRQLPQWMRGSQSVAEALAYGDSGVRCAVGMRYRLETADAERFLAAFFASLLQGAPGDVELAVRRGREDLFAQKPYPPSWSAPAIFRTSGDEPMFEWMRSPPELIDPLDERDQAVRAAIWKALAGTPPTAPPESRAFPTQFLALTESCFVDRWTKRRAAVIWPARIEARCGETVRAAISVQGALQVSCLEGRVTFPSTLVARPPRPAPALAAAGLEALFALDAPGVARFLLRGSSGGPAAIPPGVLLEIDLEVPPGAPAVHELSVDGLKSDPPALLRGWSNAVVVSP